MEPRASPKPPVATNADVMGYDLTLLTDLYQITMAQGYWQQGLCDTEACFYASYRENPFEGGYAISCGTDQIAELIEGFSFDPEAIDYLRSLPAARGGPNIAAPKNTCLVGKTG